jgi:hypothetical protein
MDEEGADSKETTTELRSDAKVSFPSTKPPLYNFIYMVVVGLCVSGITWLFRSGALQLWDRHPRPGENYEYGWFFSLLFAIPSGFFIGSLLMFQILVWYRKRSIKRKKGHDTEDL